MYLWTIGVVQKLRWPIFASFWPPTYLVLTCVDIWISTYLISTLTFETLPLPLGTSIFSAYYAKSNYSTRKCTQFWLFINMFLKFTFLDNKWINNNNQASSPENELYKIQNSPLCHSELLSQSIHSLGKLSFLGVNGTKL